MVYCVGLIGPIASGKSTLARLFQQLGVEVIYADDVSRVLTQKTGIAFQILVDHFGIEILNSAGELDRRALREKIFQYPEEKRWLENILHPLIREAISQQVKHAKTPYCLVEIPLLIERKNYPYLNRILVVVSEKKDRIRRLMARDKHCREEALNIVLAQKDEELYLKLADDVLINNDTQQDLTNKVIQLNEIYLNLAKHSQFNQDKRSEF